MFSGIVEAKAQVLAARRERGLVVIDVEKPSEFNDLRIGDSVSTSGVCLTVETFDSQKMTFALGAETLKVTGWTEANLMGATVNLERSLKTNDRNHGHMVSGHVDDVGEVVGIQDLGGSVQVDVKAPRSILRYVWKKGSWAINGVSLTVNSVENGVVSVCLIPETLRRTNLSALRVGDPVNLEVDMMARGLVNFLETSLESGALQSLVNDLQKNASKGN